MSVERVRDLGVLARPAVWFSEASPVEMNVLLNLVRLGGGGGVVCVQR